MRNKLTRLSISAVILTFALSSGAAYARNILPDAFKDLNYPYTSGQGTYTTYDRNSTRYDSSYTPGDPLADSKPGARPAREIATRARNIMERALRRYEKGEFEAACKLATEASEMVSGSQFLSGSAMDNNYSELSMKICQAAQNA